MDAEKEQIIIELNKLSQRAIDCNIDDRIIRHCKAIVKHSQAIIESDQIKTERPNLDIL